MAAERVVIEVLRVKGRRDTNLPIANVTALFTMRNVGDTAERLAVRFPLTDPSGQGDGWGRHPEIERVAVAVNNRPVAVRVITMTNPYDAASPPVKWAVFNATFPPGRDVQITVEYILQSTGYPPYGRFKYILETGAGWDGPIGSVEFILKLPYQANEQNVLLGQSTPGGQFVDQEVRWRFKDIEPQEKDNFYVTVMAPSTWQRILEARRQAEANPKSAAAWRELARAYLGAISGKYGPEQGAEFVPLIEEAYRRAQENDPGSAQLYAELAQTLLNIYPPVFHINPEVIEKILAALRAAFERDPGNALAQKVVTDLRQWLSGLAQESGATGEAAKAQLERLEQLVKQTSAGKLAPTPTVPLDRPGTSEATAMPVGAGTPEATPTPAPATPPAASTPEATPTPALATPPAASTPEATPTPAPATPAAVTGTLPAAPEASPVGITGTLQAVGTPASEGTPMAAAEVATQPAAPAEAPAAPTAVVTLPPGATAMPDAAAASQPGAQGFQAVTCIALLLVYLIGGLVVYLIHRAMIRRDQGRA